MNVDTSDLIVSSDGCAQTSVSFAYACFNDFIKNQDELNDLLAKKRLIEELNSVIEGLQCKSEDNNKQFPIGVVHKIRRILLSITNKDIIIGIESPIHYNEYISLLKESNYNLLRYHALQDQLNDCKDQLKLKSINLDRNKEVLREMNCYCSE